MADFPTSGDGAIFGMSSGSKTIVAIDVDSEDGAGMRIELIGEFVLTGSVFNI